MPRLLPAFAALLLAGPAAAQCLSQSESFLTCRINGTTELRACWGPGDAGYQYGPAGGEPELRLSVPLAELDYIPWNGVSSSIWEEANFYNANVRYSVWHWIDRNPQGKPASAGVTVTRGDQTLADLTCDPGTITVNFEGISEAKERIGLCWQDFAWQPCAAPVPVAANVCPPGSRPFLACTTRNGARQVAGCVGAQTLHYSFGAPGAAPELALTSPMEGFEYTPAALHPAGTPVAVFYNGRVGYALWAAGPAAGVEVIEGDSALAVLDCDPGSATVDFGVLDAVLAARNLCHDGLHWLPCN